MGSNPYLYYVFFLLLLLTSFTSSASTFLPYDALDPRGSTGRSLLQAKKPCGVDFEHQNYTILTSRCKGPHYPADVCCGAFKEFACPFASDIDDASTDCSATMFSYINLYGKYPPGLFANLCKEGKEGLDCNQVSQKNSNNSTASSNTSVRGQMATSHPILLMAVACLVIFLFSNWY